MKFLFVSDSCSACTASFIQSATKMDSGLEIIKVKYDESQKKFMAYKGEERLGDESPVEDTPALFLSDSNELFFGQRDILTKLTNANK